MDHKILYAALSQNKAIMRMDKRIGVDPKNPTQDFINASYFADEMQYLSKSGKKIQIRINSVGGNVLKGWDIYDAMTVCEADTHCYGLAASMAGIILTGGKNRSCDSHAICMLHGAHDEDGKENVFTKKVNDAFKILLKSRTKMSEEMIDKILAKGDHYFDASEMLEYGIVDKVIPSKIKIMDKIAQVKASANLGELANVYASLETETPSFWESIFGKKSDSENVAAALKMKGDFEKLNSDKAAADAKIITLEAELKQLKDAQAAAALTDSKAKAKKLIEDAKTAKKLVLDDKQTADMITAAEQNYAAVELMINQLGTGKRESVAAAISGDKTKVGEKTVEEMTYAELAQDHPEALAKLAETNPELFDKKADEYIKEQSKGKK